jgi:hypothetical protein
MLHGPHKLAACRPSWKDARIAMNSLIRSDPSLRRRGFLKYRAGLTSTFTVPRSGFRVTAAQPDSTAKPLRIIADADTENEIDDLFAIARALALGCHS